MVERARRDAILGSLRIVRQSGAQMPRVDALHRQLQFLDARLRAVGKVATRA
ncbi:MAG: hypothetical protein KME03_11845 [Aphanocapsa lilacina HA4352-LM1]|jgi:hypothetical protein|nr:hypothetical protein [Aphanocapsa lilacina HA4352-LM1]